MKYSEKLRKGASMCFTGKLDRESFRAFAAAGIDCAELSFNYNYYFNVSGFVDRPEDYARIAADEGVEIWSVHIPFSRKLDISTEDKELRAITLYTDRAMIRASARAGATVMVLHPSSEPIDDERRPERLRLSREAIIMLNEECERLGMKLAVEDLPRTCLCNRSGEMVELLDGTGAGAVFDTNHALFEDNVGFIDALTAGGIKIHTLHISDYFRDAAGVLDERHVLPGEGINNWNEIIDALERHGYTGPLMYEVPARPKTREVPYTFAELAENMRRLAAKEI